MADSSLQLIPSTLNLQEHSSRSGNTVIYYQFLKLHGSIYVWVGTDQGQMSGLVAAMKPRVGASVVSTLLGPSDVDNQQANQIAERLQRRTNQHIMLSLNVPNEQHLNHIEETILEQLCFS